MEVSGEDLRILFPPLLPPVTALSPIVGGGVLVCKKIVPFNKY